MIDYITVITPEKNHNIEFDMPIYESYYRHIPFGFILGIYLICAFYIFLASIYEAYRSDRDISIVTYTLFAIFWPLLFILMIYIFIFNFLSDRKVNRELKQWHRNNF